MTHSHTISLPMAILININVMLGAGIFINTAVLAQRAGILGALSYVFVGLLMFPLVLSMARLIRIYPSDGLYTFGAQEIAPIAGFWSAWGYFTGKLAAATLVIHVAMSLLQQIVPYLQTVPVFILDIFILFLFITLNLNNVKTGGRIQLCFMMLKIIPILIAVTMSIYLITRKFGLTDGITASWSGVPFTIPLALYAVSGFEAACSLSNHIKDARKNAPRAILISYGLVILIAVVYQTLFYTALGESLATIPDYRTLFPHLIHNALPSSAIIAKALNIFVYIGIIASSLGSGYSIIFSNMWNLHTLAKNDHLIGKRILTTLNSNYVPWACVIVEGIICLIYLCISQGNQIPLQQLSALGNITAYTISTCALFIGSWRNTHDQYGSLWIPFLGLGSCTLLLSTCIYSMFSFGYYAFTIYCTLLLTGLSIFFIQKYRNKVIEA